MEKLQKFAIKDFNVANGSSPEIVKEIDQRQNLCPYNLRHNQTFENTMQTRNVQVNSWSNEILYSVNDFKEAKAQ